MEDDGELVSIIVLLIDGGQYAAQTIVMPSAFLPHDVVHDSLHIHLPNVYKKIFHLFSSRIILVPGINAFVSTEIFLQLERNP